MSNSSYILFSAVLNGSLKSLQEHLDRRKFCMARDKGTNINIMQKAILLGHQSILRSAADTFKLLLSITSRYLSNNFPELINLRDREGRTALHYAAAMRDNTSVYRTLIHHGAETSVKDRAGNTPGLYNKNKKLLTKTMLMNFMNNVKEPTKVPKEEPNSAKSKLSKQKSEKEKSASVEEDIVVDVDDAELDNIDSLLAMLSSKEAKPVGSKIRFQVPFEILEQIKRRYE